MTKKQTNSTVLVLSGGLDSLVLAHQIAKAKRPFRALYLDLGKPASPREMSAVKRLSSTLGFHLDIVNLTGLHSMQLGYVPDTHLIAELDVVDPLPDHNLNITRTSGYQVLLSVGSYFAQITGSSSITLGLIKEQFQRYPRLQDALSSHAAAVGALNPHLGKFSIETPLSGSSKSDVVVAGHDLAAHLENSWSCLLGGDLHCGKCVQCKSRKAGFKVSRVKDPTAYQKAGG